MGIRFNSSVLTGLGTAGTVGTLLAFGLGATPAGAATGTYGYHHLLGDPWHITPGNSTHFTGTNLNSAQLVANGIPFTCAPAAASVTGHVSGDGKPYTPGTDTSLGTISDANFGLNGGCSLLGAGISAKITPGAPPFVFNGSRYISSGGVQKVVGNITGISESINTVPGAPFRCHVIVGNTSSGSPLPVSFYDTPYTSPNGTNYGPHVFVVDPNQVAALHVKFVSGDPTCTTNIHVSDRAFFTGIFSAASSMGSPLKVSATSS